MASGESLCTCGEPYDNTKFMIQCDICKDWLHGICVGLREHQSLDIDKYHCPRCELMCGPSIHKRRTNWHRHDPYELNSEAKPVQTGTPVFIKELRSRHFESADEVVVRLRGQQLTLPYLARHGWDRPILLDSVEGLGMQLPPAASFTVHDLENYVGSDRELDVIDVNRQRDIHVSMRELSEYFTGRQRSETFNCISLEFSGTGLAALVEAPYIVRKLCWVTSLWPTPSPEGVEKPTVSKYALVSAAESYTDFHVDFGGTSVWYHVLRGEKVFYLVRPTVSNLTLYQRWLNSLSRNSTFFGDQVDACYRLSVKAGQTLLIPSGWIHAVYTPEDSLVFGGNFLCSLNVPLQLRVYELEKKSRTPLKFRFPSFETCHWLGGRRLLDEMRDYADANQRCPLHLVQAARSLAAAFRSWALDASSMRRGVEPVPAAINASKLIKQLNKEVRHAEKHSSLAAPPALPRPERQSRRVVKKRPLDDDFIDISERSEFESLLQQADARRRPGAGAGLERHRGAAASLERGRQLRGAAAAGRRVAGHARRHRRHAVDERRRGGADRRRRRPRRLPEAPATLVLVRRRGVRHRPGRRLRVPVTGHVRRRACVQAARPAPCRRAVEPEGARAGGRGGRRSAGAAGGAPPDASGRQLPAAGREEPAGTEEAVGSPAEHFQLSAADVGRAGHSQTCETEERDGNSQTAPWKNLEAEQDEVLIIQRSPGKQFFVV